MAERVIGEAFVRLCCNTPHWGSVCPDGMVLCCICFGRFRPDELFVDSTGTTWDMCIGCGKDVGDSDMSPLQEQGP